jgi:hypothetical protein
MAKAGKNAYGQSYGEPIPLDKLRDEQWAVLRNRWERRGLWDRRLYGDPPGSLGCVMPSVIRSADPVTIDNMRQKFREDCGM